MRLALIGVGLIGGSFAKALRATGKVERIVGLDVSASALREAAELGVIDESATSMAAVADVSLVMIAAPVGSMREILRQAAPHLSESAIVTDVGSTKTSVLESARSELGAAFPRFVPGHPIAGLERSGVAHADAALFRDKLFISTPVAQTDANALRLVEALWASVGCRLERMAPEEHDAVFAAVSHLPHLLAFSLVAQIANEADAARRFAVAGAAFRDFTRIAASNPAMWTDICIANRAQLAAELKNYRKLLGHLQDALEKGDANALRQTFTRAAQMRRGHAAAGDEANFR